MKKVVVIFLTLLAVASLAVFSACGNDGGGGSSGNHFVDNSVIDNYIYLPERVGLLDLQHPAHGAMAHGDRIVYWHTDSTLSFMITELDGDVIFERDLSDISRDDVLFSVLQVAFADNGNMALVTMDGASLNFMIHLINNSGVVIGELELDFGRNIAGLQDGRVVALVQDGGSNILREIDFDTGDWGKTIPLTVTNAQRIFSVGNNQSFDLLIDTGSHVAGYELETATQTPLFSWMDIGVVNAHNAQVGLLSDGRAFLFLMEFLSTGDSFEWFTELSVLTRTSRADMPEHIVIRLGGVFIDSDIREQVLVFNRENTHYQIEIEDFSDIHDWEASLNRFRMEMMVGRGPDIIIDPGFPPIPSEFMVDLYELIDADPDLSRSDFFPNVLHAMESPEGTLAFVANNFEIETWLALRETAEQVDLLTFEVLLSLMDNPDVPLLFGDWMSREYFLAVSLYFSGDNFINWDAGTANLDSEEFISLLEIVSRMEPLPEYGGWEQSELYMRFRNREELFFRLWLSDPELLWIYQKLFGDIVAVGIPTAEGGQHAIRTPARHSIGINAGSEHQDAAWGFVRRFLLPEANIVWSLPLRIDKYEERVMELRTPYLWEQTIEEFGAVEGEERPREWHWGGPETLFSYAMTADEAVFIRDIIDSASLQFRFDETVDMIIMEGVSEFLAGMRSAEDTARIMQSRVQIYLDEQR